MERIIIEVNSSKNVEFLSKMLGKLNFIKKKKKQKPIKKTNKNQMPIEWSKIMQI